MIGEEEIGRRFNHHPPTEESTVLAHEGVRADFKDLAERMDRELPDGREKSLMLTHLEEGLFWANAAIARQR